MKPEIAVLDIQGQFRVYTELYRADAAEKTIILVNGSLATTTSFAQTVRNLHPQFNVVLYDPPYAGKSKPHNAHERPLTKELEGQLLLELIDHFNAELLMSFSWGGAGRPGPPAQTHRKGSHQLVLPRHQRPSARLPRARPATLRHLQPPWRRGVAQQHPGQTPALAVQALQPQARQLPGCA
jgi:hypothetical protein